MKYTVLAPENTITGKIQLPASKSISNRALILNALSKSSYPINNISDCDDTRVMIEAFNSGKNDINIGAAGTSMRFLTAYLAQTEGEWTITGTERMKKRPISILVNALRQLGAKIEYIENEGYPPLKITGTTIKGGEIELDGGVSSQYISALMMIAPNMTEGLIINLKGNIISQPYIFLTKKMMEDSGVNVRQDGNKIIIPAQKYTPVPYTVESDWSAASYWYEIVALSTNADTQIELVGLYPNSQQGDSKIVDLFKELGVSTQFTKEGVIIKKEKIVVHCLEYNFINEPDIAQTLVATCCLKNIPFQFSGLQSLKIKETDRILALKTELKKLSYLISDREDSIIEWNKEITDTNENVSIDTYEDHRMAMTFAPVAMVKGQITINDPHVASKSYPSYWDDLKKVGFKIIEK